MRRQLEHVRERGESVATLWASESSIYGRFGYGVAIEMEITRIPRAYSGRRSDIAPVNGTCRLLSTDEAREILPALHESIRTRFPGELRRSQEWWEIRILKDLKDYRDGHSANQYLLYEGPGGAEGYVRYRTKSAFENWLPKGVLVVGDFFASTPAATAGLWDYLLGVDLIETIEHPVGGTPDPLLAMLADPRRTNRSRLDAIWLRVVDVESALSARAMGIEGRIVIEVEDSFLDGAGGRFELEGGPDGAVCRRTTASADVCLGIEALGALYLGGGSVDQLARVGRAEGDEKSLAKLQGMLGWWRAPHCQEHF
jgi:predicted acetyltransferase